MYYTRFSKNREEKVTRSSLSRDRRFYLQERSGLSGQNLQRAQFSDEPRRKRSQKAPSALPADSPLSHDMHLRETTPTLSLGVGTFMSSFLSSGARGWPNGLLSPHAHVSWNGEVPGEETEHQRNGENRKDKAGQDELIGNR